MPLPLPSFGNFQMNPNSMKKTIQVSVAEITADLQKGIPDEQLMKKYGLSEKSLKKVFDRLLRAACNGSRHIEVESD